MSALIIIQKKKVVFTNSFAIIEGHVALSLFQKRFEANDVPSNLQYCFSIFLTAVWVCSSLEKHCK